MSDDLDFLDLRKFFNKHTNQLETYDEAKFFCIGFLISRGFSWSESERITKETLKEW